MDAAETGPSNDLELHVSRFTPGGAPRVSHDPVVNTVGGAPANNVGGVVEVGAAVSVVEDTTRVVLESELVSLDSNREDTINKHRLHSGNTTVRCILVGGALNRVERRSRVSARSISCDVRVVIP